MYKTKDPFYRWVTKNIRLLEKRPCTEIWRFPKADCKEREICIQHLHCGTSHDGGWRMFRHSYKGSTALLSDPQTSTAPRQPKYTHKRKQIGSQSVLPHARPVLKRAHTNILLTKGCCRSSSISHMPTCTVFQ